MTGRASIRIFYEFGWVGLIQEDQDVTTKLNIRS